MSEIGEEDSPVDTWRHFYENPLTVATNAMLHINGNADEQNHPQTHYEIYKDEHGSASMGGAIELKLANGGLEAVVGAEPVDSIFLQGGAKLVKREPEDLTRKCGSPLERGVVSDKRRIVCVPSHSDSPPALIPTQSLKDELESCPKDDSRINHTILVQTPLDSGDKMSATGYLGSFAGSSPQSAYETVSYLGQSPQHYAGATSPALARGTAVYPSTGDQYYREYYQVSEQPYSNLRADYSTSDVNFDRYGRTTSAYRSVHNVDSSPDSGISSDTLPPKEQPISLPQQSFAYEDLNQPTLLTTDLRPVTVSAVSPVGHRPSPGVTPPGTTRSWSEFARDDKLQIPKIHAEDDKVYIEKVDCPYGFKYYFESGISTSPRREDDRITYINKGQFYAISMEYIADPERPMKSGMVKSIIMLMFREEKSAEDERKAWHFWHGRQHSVKQRILDVDTKNSIGIAGCIEEISHNAIAVYWNPLESGAKVNISVQCLSTDFSSQKGVKGLPLHIQIDTYDHPRDIGVPVYHRGYCQIKVFCDKGAERKTRDEERRAQKRRCNPTTRKKYEDLYHAPNDRSEFYGMADLMKEPVLFKPNEDTDKVSYMNSMDIQGQFYTHEQDNGVCGVSLGMNIDGSPPTILSPQHVSSPAPNLRNSLNSAIPSPGPLASSQIPSTSSCSPPPSSSLPQESMSFTTLAPLQPPVSPKFNNRFHPVVSQAYGDMHKEMNPVLTNGNMSNTVSDDIFTHPHKRSRLAPPTHERLMIFVRRASDTYYTALHLSPPITVELIGAIEQKFQIPRSSIRNLLRQNKHGTRARIDDEMLRYYCHESCFIIDIVQRDQDSFDITMTEAPVPDHE